MFDLISADTITPQSVATALKGELRLCAFCAQIKVSAAGPRNSFLVTLVPPSEECFTNHSDQLRLADLAPGYSFVSGCAKVEIVMAETLSAQENEVSLVSAHVPQVPFVEGQRVISMLPDSFVCFFILSP